MPYWYNVDTGQVETDETRSQDADVLGPYETEEAASRALTTAREKTERWDAEEREWDERGTSSGGGDTGGSW
ncbi:methionine aminopeptidase [Phycicoccus sp. CSK15P-2]|uniref:methionine aminopeptidase n=1 Tax=Phycicoccus sp. CSK15P-2 TaxID=2807627 RepID=UPI001950B22B|nr:methionine aminopeptidase [Phycicoccus sp. CSK15P-2]MBM6403661.1 methionine aminopeptidase [Phycicoccus sp. CSK15P-2]